MNKLQICVWAPSRNKLFCRKSSFLGEQKVKTAPDHLITWNRWSGEFFCKILAPYIQQYHLELILCIKVSFFWHLKNDVFPHSNWTMIWHLLICTIFIWDTLYSYIYYCYYFLSLTQVSETFCHLMIGIKSQIQGHMRDRLFGPNGGGDDGLQPSKVHLLYMYLYRFAIFKSSLATATVPALRWNAGDTRH